jgi:hypothetical protein
MTQPSLNDQPTAEELAPTGGEALALMVTLMMQHSRQETDHIVNGLMAGFQRDYYRSAAELEIARRQVERLFMHSYMPTPDAVIEAMYPSQAAVQERVALFETRGW